MTGILNVSAADKSTGKANKITITNDKGRLNKDEIERMVADAEKYKKEDEQQKERISAKNSLESYCFNIKSSIEDENIRTKVSESDRQTVLNKVNETIRWLDSNQMAETEEFGHKQKELESICNPIITKMYQQNGGPQAGPSTGSCGRESGQGFSSGPTVEEVD